VAFLIPKKESVGAIDSIAGIKKIPAFEPITGRTIRRLNVAVSQVVEAWRGAPRVPQRLIAQRFRVGGRLGATLVHHVIGAPSRLDRGTAVAEWSEAARGPSPRAGLNTTRALPERKGSPMRHTLGVFALAICVPCFAACSTSEGTAVRAPRFPVEAARGGGGGGGSAGSVAIDDSVSARNARLDRTGRSDPEHYERPSHLHKDRMEGRERHAHPRFYK
jgi:hypothetical protein